jgi:hypothetical protein
MAPRYGTLQVIDSLATYNNTNVIAFGEAQMAGYIDIILAAYERFLGEIQAEFVGVVPDRETTYGVTNSSTDMVDLDEFGVADAMKIPFTPATVGFPLRRRGGSLQWTRDFLATTSPQELAFQVLALTEADTRRFYNDLRRAIFTPTNNTAYLDRFVDGRNLALRALVNADSQSIPPKAIDGTTFDGSTHTHYLGTGSFVEANLIALEETVREHGLNGGSLRVYINQAQEAAVRAFTGFSGYIDSRIVYGTGANRTDQAVDLINTEDRAIGIHGPAEVWVKPWMPANYVMCAIVGGAGNPVVGLRQPSGALAQFANLRIAATFDRHPLHAETYERMVGMAVWNRVGAAVLYTGNATYAAPTIP